MARGGERAASIERMATPDRAGWRGASVERMAALDRARSSRARIIERWQSWIARRASRMIA
jgi:hypothetical protein